MSFFEGTEKKFEIVFRPEISSLRDLDDAYWRSVVHSAGADIISKIESSTCSAYLLTESSLFVFEERVIMITCGRTLLTSAILKLLEKFSVSDFQLLIYERKDAHEPDLQSSSFREDVELLQTKMPGESLCLGDANDHHISLFYLTKNYEPEANDTTLELLMHGMGESAREVFIPAEANAKADVQRIREYAQLHLLLDGFQVDDFAFDPSGYSINAVKNNFYYTIHVTPQEPGCYVSFETNYCFGGECGEQTRDGLISKIVNFFQPSSCNLLIFQKEKETCRSMENYVQKNTVALDLHCGFHIQYFEFQNIEQKKDAIDE